MAPAKEKSLVRTRLPAPRNCATAGSRGDEHLQQLLTHELFVSTCECDLTARTNSYIISAHLPTCLITPFNHNPQWLPLS